MAASSSASSPSSSAAFSISPYSQIPAGVARSFIGLCNVPFRAFVPLLKLNDAGKLQERILVVTDEVIFVATADGQIRRGVPLEWLAELFWNKEQRILVLVCPTQYDLCIKLDPTYSSIGRDVSMRLLGPLGALSDDWPRLAVLIAKLREKRVANVEGSNDGLPLAPPLKLTSAVGEAANRAFRLKKPDGQFHAVLRTGSASALAALPEEEIVRRVESSVTLELEKSRQSSVCVMPSTASGDEDEDSATAPSMTMSVRWHTAETPLSRSTAAVVLDFQQQREEQQMPSTADCRNDIEKIAVEKIDVDATEQQDTSSPTQSHHGQVDRAMRSAVHPHLLQASAAMSSDPQVEDVSNSSIALSPVSASPAPRCGLEAAGPLPVHTSVENSQSHRPTFSRPPSETTNDLGALFSQQNPVVASNTPAAEVAAVIELGPSLPRNEDGRGGSSPPAASLRSGSRAVGGTTTFLMTPDPSSTRQQLSAGAPITINSAACANILEYVMQLEKERDWWQTQAESSHEESNRLQRALENAKMEVQWYRNRFLVAAAASSSHERN